MSYVDPTLLETLIEEAGSKLSKRGANALRAANEPKPAKGTKGHGPAPSARVNLGSL